MQNYVYPTRKQALAAPHAPFQLRICELCSFAFNGEFNPALLKYNKRYDNRVPSEVFEKYYQEIASYLKRKYIRNTGMIVDIGCGKGHFLQVICETIKSIHGIGIDPSLELEGRNGNLFWIRDTFRTGHLAYKPSLIVCRHVVEHIPSPTDFLKTIHNGLASFESVPCFFEVPDMDWIIRNGAFWDFCYEHCNYFTRKSISKALVAAGFSIRTISSAFKGQYLWVEAQTGKSKASKVKNESEKRFVDPLIEFCQSERTFIHETQKRLRAVKKGNGAIVVWGMATKGVVFSLLADPEGKFIDYCVDINSNKHNCFVPFTARKICGPEQLKNENRSIIIIVMNPNYAAEICTMCTCLGISATFVDPKWSVLS
jgi:hypothetical protein